MCAARAVHHRECVNCIFSELEDNTAVWHVAGAIRIIQFDWHQPISRRAISFSHRIHAKTGFCDTEQRSILHNTCFGVVSFGDNAVCGDIETSHQIYTQKQMIAFQREMECCNWMRWMFRNRTQQKLWADMRYEIEWRAIFTLAQTFTRATSTKKVCSSTCLQHSVFASNQLRAHNNSIDFQWMRHSTGKRLFVVSFHSPNSPNRWRQTEQVLGIAT